MEPSSSSSYLSDAQQLIQQYQEYQAQQQQQQEPQQQQQQIQNYASQTYDPSHPAPYDQNQAYYSYYQQYQQPQPQQQQYAAYYQSDYAAAYHQPAQPQPTGALLPHEADSGGAGYPVPQGLNAAAAAAVAALSQLTQFAGTMGAAERAMAGFQGRGPGPGPFMGPGPMHPTVGWSPYRGGGRKTGRPFRGGGHGNFGQRNSGPLRGRGRGRGRGGPRHFPSHGASSTSSHPEPSVAEDPESMDDGAEPSFNAPEGGAQVAVPPEPSSSVQSQGKVEHNRRPPQAAWCELCRVDCTSVETLEQHKNGKKHKKNLQKLEELKNAVKLGADIQNEQNPTAESEQKVSQKPESEQDDKENTRMENLPAESVTDENKEETEQQTNTVEQPEIPVQESSDLQGSKPRMDQFDNQRHGMKRKMRGGRGGKRMRTFEPPKRHIEPPKPKVVIPLICDLCNVKCDTREVFDRHLAGKKHLAKLKRFEGHQAMYGPMGLQALYPPNPIAQTLYLPQGHQQPYNGPQGSFPPSGPYMTTQANQAASTAIGMDPQFQQYPNPQSSEAFLGSGSHMAVTMMPNTGQQEAIVEPEMRQALAVEGNPVNGVSDSGSLTGQSLS
uniref:U1-type domain-containing protein n=1 Tax=Fagus sylvatica TaxID=28930 RepID=A0A2N9GH96_FAGSY